MFDDSDKEDSDIGEPKADLFKQVKPLKAPVEKKAAAKKPAVEKKPRAPAKKKTEKGENRTFIMFWGVYTLVIVHRLV